MRHVKNRPFSQITQGSQRREHALFQNALRAKDEPSLGFGLLANDTPSLGSGALRCWQPRSTSPVCNFAVRPRRAVSETTFDGTLIPETSFETLRSEDSLAKRVSAIRIEKPTKSGTCPICYKRDELPRARRAAATNHGVAQCHRLPASARRLAVPW